MRIKAQFDEIILGKALLKVFHNAIKFADEKFQSHN